MAFVYNLNPSMQQNDKKKTVNLLVQITVKVATFYYN